MKKKKKRFSMKQALGFGKLRELPEALYARPALHWDSEGSLELENCRQVLRYEEDHLELDMGAVSLLITGDGLWIDTYRKNYMTVRGRLFSIEVRYGRQAGHE